MFQWIKEYGKKPKKVNEFLPFEKCEYTNRPISKEFRDGNFIMVCLEPRMSLFGLDEKSFLLEKYKRRVVGLNYILFRPYIYIIPKTYTFKKKYDVQLPIGGNIVKYEYELEITIRVFNGEEFYKYAFSPGSQGDFLNVEINSTESLQKFIVEGPMNDYLQGLLSRFCRNGKNTVIVSQNILSDDFMNKWESMLQDELMGWKEQIRKIESHGWKLDCCNLKIISQ